jgi:hypothetical protein
MGGPLLGEKGYDHLRADACQQSACGYNRATRILIALDTRAPVPYPWSMTRATTYRYYYYFTTRLTGRGWSATR